MRNPLDGRDHIDLYQEAARAYRVMHLGQRLDRWRYMAFVGFLGGGALNLVIYVASGTVEPISVGMVGGTGVAALIFGACAMRAYHTANHMMTCISDANEGMKNGQT